MRPTEWLRSRKENSAPPDALQGVHELLANGNPNEALMAATLLGDDSDLAFADRVRALDIVADLYGQSGLVQEKADALQQKATLQIDSDDTEGASDTYIELANCFPRTPRSVELLQTAKALMETRRTDIQTTNALEDGLLLGSEAQDELARVDAKVVVLDSLLTRALRDFSDEELERIPAAAAQALLAEHRLGRRLARTQNFKLLSTIGLISVACCIPAIPSFLQNYRTVDFKVPKTGQYLGKGTFDLGKGREWVFDIKHQGDARRVNCGPAQRILKVDSEGHVYVLCSTDHLEGKTRIVISNPNGHAS